MAHRPQQVMESRFVCVDILDGLIHLATGLSFVYSTRSALSLQSSDWAVTGKEFRETSKTCRGWSCNIVLDRSPSSMACCNKQQW